MTSEHDTVCAYNAVADLYVRLARADSARRPLDRAIVSAFADSVRLAGGSMIADLGCGPGFLTAHLRDLGLDVTGIDLSATFVDIARTEFPDLRFEVGSMRALDFPDTSLHGIQCWYSIIHTEPSEIPEYFQEFRRVLAPGGHLLLAFFEADEDTVTTFDHKVTTAYRWPINALVSIAGQAGFTELARLSRQPEAGERHPRGHLLLRLGPTA